jgi:carboxyl-terminal processing protease
MKNTKILLLLLLFFNTKTNSQVTLNKNSEKDKQILSLVLSTLKDKHIHPIKIDDEFSKNLFEAFIDLLDPNKLFFYKSDIVEFRKYETLIDNQILIGDLSFVNLVKERYILRMIEGKEIYTDLLKNTLDFNNDKINASNINKNLFI